MEEKVFWTKYSNILLNHLNLVFFQKNQPPHRFVPVTTAG